jgi:DNA-binding IclR family transcriptional regulator
MAVKTQSSPFGSGTRTRVLLVLQLLGESYSRELARTLDLSVSVVQKALRSLERDGLVAGRSAGRTKLYQLNPRFFASAELGQLLRKLAEPDLELNRRLAALRKRPRRSGKPLWP